MEGDGLIGGSGATRSSLVCVCETSLKYCCTSVCDLSNEESLAKRSFPLFPLTLILSERWERMKDKYFKVFEFKQYKFHS